MKLNEDAVCSLRKRPTQRELLLSYRLSCDANERKVLFSHHFTTKVAKEVSTQPFSLLPSRSELSDMLFKEELKRCRLSNDVIRKIYLMSMEYTKHVQTFGQISVYTYFNLQLIKPIDLL